MVPFLTNEHEYACRHESKANNSDVRFHEDGVSEAGGIPGTVMNVKASDGHDSRGWYVSTEAGEQHGLV